MILQDLTYITGLAFLLTHELDAIHRREWRFFFGPISVRDATARATFVGLHAPLFALILWRFDAPGFRTGVSIFLLVHAGLHWALRNHPLVDFNNWFSRTWIYGAALLGGAHLWLVSH